MITILNAERISPNILFKISRRSYLQLKIGFSKKSCQFKVTDRSRHLKVPTSSLVWLSKPHQHTYISLIGSLFIWKYILAGIMEMQFPNVHFIVKSSYMAKD